MPPSVLQIDRTAGEPAAAGAKQSRPVASERVFAALRERIIAMELTPGCHLTEADLTREFHVSATPVREALQRLVQAGLACREPARGVRVHRPTVDEIRDIYELRLVLEPAALRSSLVEFENADWVECEQILSTARAAIQAGRAAELSRINSQFHTRLLSRSRNRLLRSTISGIEDRRRLISIQGWALRDRSLEEWKEHSAILEAGRQGDTGKAARLLERHIRRFMASTLEALGAGCSRTPPGAH